MDRVHQFRNLPAASLAKSVSKLRHPTGGVLLYAPCPALCSLWPLALCPGEIFVLTRRLLWSITYLYFHLPIRHYRYEHKLACLLWKVDIREVIITNFPDSINDPPSSALTVSSDIPVTRRSLLGFGGHHGSNNNNSSNGSIGPTPGVKGDPIGDLVSN